MLLLGFWLLGAFYCASDPQQLTYEQALSRLEERLLTALDAYENSKSKSAILESNLQRLKSDLAKARLELARASSSSESLAASLTEERARYERLSGLLEASERQLEVVERQLRRWKLLAGLSWVVTLALVVVTLL